MVKKRPDLAGVWSRPGTLSVVISEVLRGSRAARERRIGSALLTASGGMVLASALAFASATPASAQEAEADAIEEITVTGSRIRRQDYVANSPIVTIDTETFDQTASIGMETILNQMPQFLPGVTGGMGPSGALQLDTGGSQFSAGGVEANAYQTPGASTVNLRGLGAGRNLVLIDGRRGMPLNATMSVDTNSIPAAAVQRVEIISGGASAVYGADAVAGAVNFILKDDFEGLEVDSNMGVPELGDGAEFRISTLFGANTPDGRGNVMLGIEHANRKAGDLNKRDWFINDRAHPAVGGSDFFFSDTYIAPDFFNLPNQAVIDALFPEAAPGALTPVDNYYVNRTPDGSGTLFTTGGVRDGAYKYEGPLVENGFPFRKIDPLGGLHQNQLVNPLAVPMERYSLFAKGRYDMADGVRLFGHATFARTATKTSSQFSPAVPGWAVDIPHGDGIYADSFANPATAILGYDPVTGRPIFDPNAPTDIAYQSGGAFGLNCGPIGGCTNSEVFPKTPEVNALLDSRFNPNGDVTIGRVLDFLGERTTENTTTNFQIVAGVEGEFGRSFYWDASISHGQSEAHSVLNNFGSVERYRAIARSPNYGRAFTMTGNEAGGGFGGGTATCTSGLPLFEDFAVSADCMTAIRTSLSQNGRMVQETVEANLGGTAAEMPAGPLQFVVGAGYRKNEYEFYTTDNNREINFNDLVMGLFPAGDTVGKIDVREVYGELLVPLISDGPTGMRSLSLELGGRHSDYNTSGGVDTAKALLDWTIVDWARLRGGFQKATRAPNIYELFTGRSLSIFSAGSSHGDICSLNNFDSALSAATGVRAGAQPGDPDLVAPATAEQAAQTLAMCQAMMGEGGALAYYSRDIADQPDPGGSGQVWVTGNPNVQPETAETLTLGLVVTSQLQNPWLRGFTGSLDWFQIEIDDVISQSSATLVSERCFSVDLNPEGDINNPWCELVKRHPQTGDSLSTDVTFTNETRVKLSGIDLQVNWSAQLVDLGLNAIPGSIGVNLMATVPLKIETQLTADSVTRDWVGHLAGGECPSGISCTGYDYQLYGTFNYFWDRLGVTLRWQRYPSIDAGALVTNPDSTARGVHSSYDLFGLSASYRLRDRFMIRGGIDNLFDKDPPVSGGNPLATNYPVPATHMSGGIYDPYGRRYFMGLNVSF